jgi:DNA-binding response OmpR family regulator
MTGARILLVEDDPDISEIIASGLALEGHQVEIQDRGAGLAERLDAGSHDLVILDRMLPDAEGAALCRALRAAGHDTMILMVTARDALHAKLEGLDAGADDYLTKPFALSELIARVHALLRRAGRSAAPVPVLTLGPLVLDRGRAAAEIDGLDLGLTATEFALLATLMENPGRIVSRTELLKEVWGYGFDPHTNVVEVYVSYLRRKLAAATQDVVLRNVRGFGYTIEAS